MHAITAANNALSALVDNHIQQGNELGIDPRRIIWKRVVDLNDRALRQVIVGLGGPLQREYLEKMALISPLLVRLWLFCV